MHSSLADGKWKQDFHKGTVHLKMWQRALPGVKMFDILRLKHLMEGNGAE